ncbi:response regulator transcription factor [Paenibacillus sp. sptzw28]|uniref:response regulator transcription factor n=1 Tax=Paenibacillus sp. sptzw28 TaxID=715179 RepID=UPI001C6E34BA|nr:response regulator transcription factor [Paenibacillus sp. sptzw28]QYR22028.1 response regulator transcription factor [Paenibacillus sp. sptzw28]
MAGTIVIADDESNITDVCRRYLEREGYVVRIAHDGAEALRLWEECGADLLVLDLMMPRLDGWQVCETVRQTSDVPVIMLTARGEEPDRLLGLTMGADDYMTKPFSPRELVLRVKNILRRAGVAAPAVHAAGASSSGAGKNGNGAPVPPAAAAIHYDGLAIYPDERRVVAGGAETELTVKEFDLLLTLAEYPGRVFSRSQLLSRIWDTEFDGDTTTVTVHIRRLREKMEQTPSEPRWIKTVWGIGYKFDAKGQP